MMEIYVEGRRLRIDTDDVLVAGSVGGYAVHFSFGPGWQSDAVVAVFEANESISREVIIPPDGVVGIPWEVLTEAGSLRIGVYSVGVDGVKPTVWSAYQQVYPGTEPAEPPKPYESTPWQEAVTYMGDTMNETKEASEAAADAAAKAALSEEQAQGLAQSAAESANAAETAKQHAAQAAESAQQHADAARKDADFLSKRSAVWIGEEAPTEPGYDLWVNPEGRPTQLPSGGGSLAVDGEGNATINTAAFAVDADGNATI